MYNIVLCCVSAVSSSVMVTKIKEACTRDNIQALVWSIGEAGLDLAWSEADVIMLTTTGKASGEQIKGTSGSSYSGCCDQ